MIVRFLLASLCLGTVAALPASAQTTGPEAAGPATTQASPQAILSLIAQLGADDYQSRQRAQDALVEIGAEALPLLQKTVAKTEDEEVRTRATATIRAIEDGAKIRPSLITLHYRDAPAEKVLADLARQAKMEYALYPPDLFKVGQVPAVTIDIDRKPFWPAIKEVCVPLGLNLRYLYDAGKYTILKETEAPLSSPSVNVGPLLLTADTVNFNGWMNFARPGQGNRSSSMQLSIYVEPRLRISAGQLRVDKLVDDKGTSLIADNSPPLQFNRQQDHHWLASVSLNALPAAGAKLTVKGQALVAVEVEKETLVVEDILKAKNAMHQIGNRRIRVDEVVVQNAENYELRLTLYRDEIPEEVWRTINYPYNHMKLLDKNGRALSAAGGSGGGSGQEVSFRQFFARQASGDEPAPGEPVKMVWQMTTKTQEVTVPFEFGELGVP